MSRTNRYMERDIGQNGHIQGETHRAEWIDTESGRESFNEQRRHL